MAKNLTIYHYHLYRGWYHTAEVYEAEELHDYVQSEGYKSTPVIMLGDELNFVSVNEHETKDEFIIQMQLDDLERIFKVIDFPSLIDLLPKLCDVMEKYVKIMEIVDELNKEDD